MNYQNDDLRIKEIKELLPPVALLEKFPATENAANTVAHARKAIHKILKGNDDRLLVVIGPCSIHDPVAAKEYATRLLALREELKDELEIVMRVYFEKPRTTVGWKGLINDPHMDNSFQINDGLRIARKLLLDINDSGQAARQAAEQIRLGGIAFGFPFDGIPVFQHLFGIIRLGRSKHMGVTNHQLAADAIHHIAEIEGILLFLNAGVKHHLHQHVAQLLLQQLGILPLDGLQRFMGLLQKIGANALVILFPVPGTALRGTQQAHDHQHNRKIHQ